MKFNKSNRINQKLSIESRIGSACFVLFLVFRQIFSNYQNEIVGPLCLGVLISLAIVNVTIGMLPETTYQNVNKFKSSIVSRFR